MIHQRPILASISNNHVWDAAVVVYLASAILPPLQTHFRREYRQPSAVLWLAEEIARPKLDEKYLASQLHFDVLRTQLLAVLRSTFHPFHPFRRERTMPDAISWSTLTVYHDSVPPIIHISTSPAGIANMYTHLGRPSKLFSSLVRISISSFIIVSF